MDRTSNTHLVPEEAAGTVVEPVGPVVEPAELVADAANTHLDRHSEQA